MQPVFLALNEGTAEVAKTGMEAVIGAMTDVFTLSGTVVDQILPSSPFCCSAWPLVWCPLASTFSPA